MDLISEAGKQELTEMELVHRGTEDAIQDNLSDVNFLLHLFSNNFSGTGTPENKKNHIDLVEKELIQLIKNVR